MGSRTDGADQALPEDGFEVLTEWRPARLLSENHAENGFALLVLNQPLNNLDLLKLVWKKAGYRIAADGGGNRLHKAFNQDTSLALLMKDIPLETIYGDLDSLKKSTESWARSHNTTIAKDPSQDSTDFTKCISYIVAKYLPTLPTPLPSIAARATDILVLGGLGGRVDQSLSILHHLYKSPELYPQGRIYLLTTSAITFLLPAGVHRIVVKDPEAGNLGRHIGILPVGEPARITTSGLEWDVQDWETSFGGQMSTSNLVREDVVRIETTGGVLFTIDLRSKDEDDG